MLSNIRLLFNERAFLIAKQLSLAKNLQQHYVSQQIPKSAQDYGNLHHLHREIIKKERAISELSKIENNLKFRAKK